jgi:hypothetical protein
MPSIAGRLKETLLSRPAIEGFFALSLRFQPPCNHQITID